MSTKVDIVDGGGRTRRSYLLRDDNELAASAHTRKTTDGGRLISNVWTDDRHAGKGYSRQVLNSVFNTEPRPLWLRPGRKADGVVMSASALDRFYRRLGFIKSRDDLLVKPAGVERVPQLGPGLRTAGVLSSTAGVSSGLGFGWTQKPAGQAFTRALAFESITDEMADKYDFNSRKYYGITADELARYARIIARKMQHNLENGHRKLAGLSIRDVHEVGKVVPRNLSLKRRYSGSYPKGQVEWNGLRISIETPRGHWRIGKKPDGKLWFTKMRDPYGYFQRRAGYDGDSLDVFIGPRLRSPWVFVINQVDPKTGRFDEHKCVIGCSTAEEARRIYLRNYEPDWRGYGGSVRLHVNDFKRWASKAVDGAAERPGAKAANYSPPMGVAELRRNYPHLLRDPAHRWRAETGVELVHREPTEAELRRIMANWEQMSPEEQDISDRKSMELYGVTNRENYSRLLPGYNKAASVAFELGARLGARYDFAFQLP